MDLECVQYAKADHIATVVLNRPKVLNAMNKQLWLDFQTALADARDDRQVRCLILTGAGRAFSTGADLKESKDRSLNDYRDYLEALQQASLQIIRFPKPTIAAINGYALGSGYELALACDLRIAAHDAQIGSPEARVSSSLTGGAFRLLQQLVGPGKAKELLFTAENIDGREAERIGLVNRSVESEQLLPAAQAMAAKIAANSAFSIQLIKKGLHLSNEGVSLQGLMDFEIEACLACVSSKDRQGALEDFEGRKRN